MHASYAELLSEIDADYQLRSTFYQIESETRMTW